MISHAIITGTGRTGSSFIIQILTLLGLDTGYKPNEIDLVKKWRGGLEQKRFKTHPGGRSPYILKNPNFCTSIRNAIDHPNIKIDHIFIPIRNLFGAAESRRHVVRENNKLKIPGGLVHTDSMRKGEQEKYLLLMIYNLMIDISDTFIPITLINYPKLTKDSNYLYKKLKPILKKITKKQFKTAFDSCLKPEWVHSFKGEE